MSNKSRKAVQVKETAVDKKLVETAVKEISDIIVNQIENAMKEVGKYIIKAFFGDNIELAKQKKPIKDKSLLKVFEKIKESHSSFSKSWFYNAINIVIDQKELSSFHTYGNLSLSCKVLLTHVKDIEIKKEILDEIKGKGSVTVIEFKELIDNKKDSRDFGVLRLLKRPDKLLEERINTVLPDSKLKELPPKKISTAQKTVTDKIASLQKQIEDNNKLLKKYQNVENRLNKLAKEKKTQTK